MNNANIESKKVASSGLGRAVQGWRAEQGMTQAELARRIGLATASQVSRREDGETGFAYHELQKLAEVFGKSMDEIQGHIDAGRMAHTFRPPNNIPVINRAPAGTVMQYDQVCNWYSIEYHDAAEYLPRHDITDPAAFAVIVTGNSMEPRIRDGDYCVCSPMNVPNPRAQLEDGVAVFVQFAPEVHKGGCCLARWQKQKDGTIWLTKDNPKHKTIKCSPADLSRVAVVVELRTKSP